MSDLINTEVTAVEPVVTPDPVVTRKTPGFKGGVGVGIIGSVAAYALMVAGTKLVKKGLEKHKKIKESQEKPATEEKKEEPKKTE